MDDAVRGSAVCGTVEVIIVNMQLFMYAHGVQSHQDQNNGEKFLVTNSEVYLLVIEFVLPKGHRFVVLDNVGSHSIAGSISVTLKWFAVKRVDKKTI